MNKMLSIGSTLSLAIIGPMLSMGHSQAAVITETFTFPTLTGNFGSEAGTSFSKFDPALGTLDSISVSLAATATFTGMNVGNVINYLFQFNSHPPVFQIPLQIQKIGDGTTSRSITSDLLTGLRQFYTGSGTVDTRVIASKQFGPRGTTVTTFPAESITYSYTPAPPPSIPEPASLALLGAGVLGVGIISRRRLTAMR